MPEQQGREHPVITLPTIAHAVDAIAQRIDFGREGQNAIPGFRHIIGITTGLAHEIGVIIENRIGCRKSQADLTAVEACQVQQTLRIAIGFHRCIGFDKRGQIDADIAFSQDTQTVEADKADIRHFSSSGLTQHQLQAFFIGG